VVRIGLPVEHMTDDALLAGLAGGGPEVGLAFVRRFQRHVFGVALAVVGDPGVAEEVAQQAFERAWRRAGSFDPSRGTVRTWLTTIAHNLAIDAVRSRKPTPVDPTDLIRLLGPGTDDLEQKAIRQDAARQLRAALAQLPPEQARAVVMAGVYGLTAQEVAVADEIPLGTAKTRIRSAMQKLRQNLDLVGAHETGGAP
jgi:RNA polymerase sigma factor (sigma-70 family)